MTQFKKSIFVNLVISVVIGFLLAGSSVKIQYPCTVEQPDESISRCVAFEKALMHPNDLMNNKQDSLNRFVGAFATSTVTTFALLSTFSYFRKKGSKKKQ